MMKLDERTIKRLIHIKRLYVHGHEHISYGTEFDRLIAIHNFDNSIELLLKCVATEYEINLGDPLHLSFYKLWSKVSREYKQRLDSELPKETEVFHLHRIRTDVQHWGISPFSLEFVKDSDICTCDFIKTILGSVFGLRYDELFMSALVNDSKIKGLLADAERHLADENWKETILKVSIAFALARRKAHRKRYLHTVPKMGDIPDEVDILALGLDMEEYKKFIENTPVVLITLGEKPIPQWTRKLNYTRENTLFCFSFVLNAILRWHL